MAEWVVGKKFNNLKEKIWKIWKVLVLIHPVGFFTIAEIGINHGGDESLDKKVIDSDRKGRD